MTAGDAYTAPAYSRLPAHIRGPLGYEPRDTPIGSAVAIGFCARCGVNARRTTTTRGLFDCPNCTYVWWDKRVGKQNRSFEDYLTPT